eukprot:CAMPEP_0206382230 /NCGR_PEP_ID=MMETSP0294-20121207/13138_1 /ASSEMBLY_ACC=CAM_ASM_000327 /TAXON_ID=39354 /ORGANISM="Heterosigma akashiwo, Strain CCMP2393" /LENGTH=440 /DNA_ID=CAMNT_0053831875 /DNA_START=31 /DNA_END=1356 /DNA_ORIENTATION=+
MAPQGASLVKQGVWKFRMLSNQRFVFGLLPRSSVKRFFTRSHTQFDSKENVGASGRVPYKALLQKSEDEFRDIKLKLDKTIIEEMKSLNLGKTTTQEESGLRALALIEPNEEKLKEERKVPVRARYVARGLDPIAVYQRVYGGRFADVREDSILVTQRNRVHSQDQPYARYEESHTAIFKYGSVVFFNCSDEQIRKQLKDIEKFCSGSIPTSFQHKDDHTIIIEPSLTKACQSQRNHSIVREINYKNLAVIGRVLGQTVALNHYEAMVDHMLEDFNRLNSVVEQTGKFTAMETQKLFKLVARNNSIFVDVISKVGLLERSETAWKHSEFDELFEGLREEFDLETRFANLEVKLGLIQNNTKFFLEILHNAKSTSLEWIIIILILAEIIVALCDMFGYKPPQIFSSEANNCCYHDQDTVVNSSYNDIKGKGQHVIIPKAHV